jgi:signal transduction histidine kinase
MMVEDAGGQATGGSVDENILANAAARLRVAEDLSTVQQVVRTAARILAHADGATFVLRDADHCFYADEDAISPLWKGQRFPVTSCISGWAMLHAQSVVVPDITADERIPLASYRPTFVKSLAMVPIGGDKPVAAIGAYWARRHAAAPAEMAGLEALARAAGEAIQRIGLFGAATAPVLSPEPVPGQANPVEMVPRSPVLSEDHERIARDLHDTILQRMFATGLRLQAVQGTLGDQPAAQAIDEVVAEIDEVIRDLRGVIFGLEYGHERLGGLAGEILAVAAVAARSLGVEPQVIIDGPLDHVAEPVRHELTSALREMLSNVSRHARASRVRVECSSGDPIRLRVTDNGVGLPASPGVGSGLGNLAARARSLGGSFSIGPASGRGTTAVLSVPASQPAR